MGTSLKGMGAFRRELLLQLITRFRRASFTFREASTIPGFSRAVFMTLYKDGMLKKASKGLPLRYSIASTPNNERNSPSMKVKSDIASAVSRDGGCLCSGIVDK